MQVVRTATSLNNCFSYCNSFQLTKASQLIVLAPRYECRGANKRTTTFDTLICKSSIMPAMLLSIFAVIGLYYLLYLPAIAEAQLDYDATVKFYVSRVIVFLFYANAICNPIVYVWQNRHFKDAFKSFSKSGKRAKETFNKNRPRTLRDISSRKTMQRRAIKAFVSIPHNQRKWWWQ